MQATSSPRQRRVEADNEVFDRLRKYEDLLEKNKIPFEPFQRQGDKEKGVSHVGDDDLDESVQRSSPASPHVKAEDGIALK